MWTYATANTTHNNTTNTYACNIYFYSRLKRTHFAHKETKEFLCSVLYTLKGFYFLWGNWNFNASPILFPIRILSINNLYFNTKYHGMNHVKNFLLKSKHNNVENNILFIRFIQVNIFNIKLSNLKESTWA